MENKVIAKEYVEKNYVSKERIINKIKECNKIRQTTNDDDIYRAEVNYIDILEELLEDK